jgi:hypothetical protein
MSEETTIYQAEWEQFKDRQANGWIVVLVGLLTLVVAIFLSRMYEGADAIISKLGPFLFALFFGVLILLSRKGRFPKCPRCKKAFLAYRSTNNRYCISCGLPKYYGSSHYFDEWGTIDGNKMADEIRAGTL